MICPTEIFFSIFLRVALAVCGKLPSLPQIFDMYARVEDSGGVLLLTIGGFTPVG